MPSLQFENLGWIEAGFGPDEERATTALLRIAACDLPSLEITKVEDRIAQSLRSHINVPLAPLALWLAMNWRRLRFEGKPDVPTIRWFQAHRLSSIGGDQAWPPLDIYSDKEFIRLEMDAETAFDAAAVRYQQPVSLDVPADDFETAVDAFLDHVDARLAATLPAYTRLRELRAELAEERRRDSNVRVCRSQAMAALDPGDGLEPWITEATALVEGVGVVAGDEIMCVLPGFDGRMASVRRVVDETRCSPTAIDLSWVVPHAIPLRGLPWQQGVELARHLRRAQGLERGPPTNEKLSDLVGVRLPLPGEALRPPLGGGIRNGQPGAPARIFTTKRGVSTTSDSTLRALSLPRMWSQPISTFSPSRPRTPRFRSCSARSHRSCCVRGRKSTHTPMSMGSTTNR